MISLDGIGEGVDDLIKLPGVGRKTANVYLVAVKDVAAIGVDTHLSYTSQKLGWSKNKNPYKIERDLMILFPRRYWALLNPIVVKFGQIFKSRKEKDSLLKGISKI